MDMGMLFMMIMLMVVFFSSKVKMGMLMLLVPDKITYAYDHINKSEGNEEPCSYISSERFYCYKLLKFNSDPYSKEAKNN